MANAIVARLNTRFAGAIGTPIGVLVEHLAEYGSARINSVLRFLADVPWRSTNHLGCGHLRFGGFAFQRIPRLRGRAGHHDSAGSLHN